MLTRWRGRRSRRRCGWGRSGTRCDRRDARLEESSLARDELFLQHLLQRVAHALDLVLGHLREELQRDRAVGDVLGDRIIAFGEAEAILDVRLKVDRREVV